MANYRGERRCNKDAALNGLVFIDYDHLDNSQSVLQKVFDEWGGKEEIQREQAAIAPANTTSLLDQLPEQLPANKPSSESAQRQTERPKGYALHIEEAGTH